MKTKRWVIIRVFELRFPFRFSKQLSTSLSISARCLVGQGVSRKLRPRKLRPQATKTQTTKTQTSKTQTSKTQTTKTQTSKTQTTKTQTSKTQTSKTRTTKTQTSKTQTLFRTLKYNKIIKYFLIYLLKLCGLIKMTLPRAQHDEFLKYMIIYAIGTTYLLRFTIFSLLIRFRIVFTLIQSWRFLIECVFNFLQVFEENSLFPVYKTALIES